MKLETKTKLRESLVVGSAFLMSTSLSAAAQSASPSPRFQDNVNLTEAMPSLSETSVSTSESSKTIRIRGERTWTRSTARRFARLALTRAKLEATPEENAEFDQLQQTRRERFPETSNEFLEQWQQSRFRRELLEVLRRNVKFLSPEDQARIGSRG